MVQWLKSLDKEKKWLLGSMVAAWIAQALYVLSPLDIVPDFIPVIGWLDDIAALVSVISFTVYGVRQLRKHTGFAGLGPERAATRDLPEPVVAVDEPVSGIGNPRGIEGYQPLSYDELKAL